MKKWIGVALAVVLLCTVFICARSFTPTREAPSRVAANVLIQETGRYTSPSGKFVVDVWAESENHLKFFFKCPKTGNGGGPGRTFQAGSDWFLCWDDQDRLWSYIPEQDSDHCRFWYASAEVCDASTAGSLASGSSTAGDLGGWEGVPKLFFASLPKTVKDTYRRSISIQALGNSEHRSR